MRKVRKEVQSKEISTTPSPTCNGTNLKRTEEDAQDSDSDGGQTSDSHSDSVQTSDSQDDSDHTSDFHNDGDHANDAHSDSIHASDAHSDSGDSNDPHSDSVHSNDSESGPQRKRRRVEESQIPENEENEVRGSILFAR